MRINRSLWRYPAAAPGPVTSSTPGTGWLARAGFCLFWWALAVLRLPAQESYLIRHYDSENGLPQNQVNSLVTDRQGFVWTATQGGIFRFDGKVFREWQTREREPRSMPRCLLLSTEGDRIRVHGSYAHGLISHTGVDALYEPFARLFFDSIHAITFDTAALNRLYRPLSGYSFDYLHYPRLMARSREEFFFLYKDTLYYSGGGPLRRLGYSPDLLYTLYRQDTAWLIEPGGARLFRGGQALPGRAALQDEEGLPLRLRQGDRLLYSRGTYFLVASGHLYRLLDGGGPMVLRFRKLVDAARLPGIQPLCISTSVNGQDIYLGTYNQGLFHLKYLPMQTLADPEPGRRWVNYFNYDGYRVITQAGAVLGLKQSALQYKTVPVRGLEKTYRSRRGYFYTERADGRIEKTDSLGRILARFDSLHPTNSAFCEDEQGRLYVVGDGGIWQIGTGDEVNLIYPDKLKGNFINLPSICVVSDTLWTTSPGNGVFSFDLRRKTAHEWVFFKQKECRFICPDPQGGLFICTYGQGVFHLQGNRIRPLPLDAGKALRYAHQIIFDRFGMVWLPSNNGLYKISYALLKQGLNEGASELPYWKIGADDGLPSNEFNGGFSNSFYYDGARGRLLLANAGGVVVLNDQYPDNLGLRPPPAVEWVQDVSDGRTWNYWPAELQIRRALRIRVTIPGLDDDENHQLEYRVGKGSAEWLPLLDNELVLQRPGPGRLRLEFRYRSGLRSDQYLSSTYELWIAPRWYETTAVKLLLITLALVMLPLFFYLVYRRTLRQKRKLDVQVARKTRELNQKILELDKKNRENSMLLSVLVHDVKAPLQYLDLLSGRLREQAGEEPVPPRYLTEMSRSLSRLYQFITQFLTWMKLRQGASFDTEMVDLSALIRELADYAQATGIARAGEISLAIPAAPVQLKSNANLLRIILLNTVENACKYSGQKPVSLRIWEEGERIRIACADQGPGMEAQQVNALLQAGDRLKADYSSSFKMGFHFIKVLLARLGGTLEVESRPGQGTTILFSLPQEAPPD